MTGSVPLLVSGRDSCSTSPDPMERVVEVLQNLAGKGWERAVGRGMFNSLSLCK